MSDLRPKSKLPTAVILLGTVVIGGLIGLSLSWNWTTPRTRELLIKARQYAYEPSVIHVNAGDTLRIRLASLDVVHGFYVEGHDIDAEIHPQQKKFLLRRPSTGEDWREVEELTFVVGRPGKYRYRCSHTCGSMHAFMLGEMIVAPNLTLHAGIGSLAGLFLGMVFTAFAGTKPPEPEPADQEGKPDADVSATMS